MKPCTNFKTREAGFVLVMALVFLLILTILGMSAMSTTNLEEKMTNNMKDRNLAFQSAETALTSAESWIYNKVGKPSPIPDTAHGLYNASTTEVPTWDQVNWTGSNLVTYPCTPATTSSCGSSLSKVARQPKYIIEQIAEIEEEGGTKGFGGSYASAQGTRLVTIYRITARGTGGTDAAVVMVQSTYGRSFD